MAYRDVALPGRDKGRFVNDQGSVVWNPLILREQVKKYAGFFSTIAFCFSQDAIIDCSSYFHREIILSNVKDKKMLYIFFFSVQSVRQV